MSVGLELARLVREQAVETQSRQVPASALVAEGDVVQAAAAARELTPLETAAGPITWDQPRTLLKSGRKVFFPNRKRWGSRSMKIFRPCWSRSWRTWEPSCHRSAMRMRRSICCCERR